MNIDLKHDLLKNQLSDIKLGQKNVQTTIEKSMVTSPDQKLLDMNLATENHKNNDLKKKKKKLEASKKQIIDESVKKNDDKIERNPLKLLYLF